MAEAAALGGDQGEDVNGAGAAGLMVEGIVVPAAAQLREGLAAVIGEGAAEIIVEEVAGGVGVLEGDAMDEDAGLAEVEVASGVGGEFVCLPRRRR